MTSPHPERLPAPLLLQFPQIADARGRLSCIELTDPGKVPFVVRRLFFIYDVPDRAERGGHAHRQLEQVLVAVSGSFDISLDDGRTCQTMTLSNPGFGIYVPARVWLKLARFSPGATCLVLASHGYDEADYWRDYGEFRSTVACPP